MRPLPIILVHLRKPNRSLATESRTDPLFECGCFGLTGCHNANLLSGTKASGARLGFVQPGRNLVRLVFLTPPVRIVNHGACTAAHWSPADMPLRFQDSVILVDNEGRSDVPHLKKLFADAQRPTWVSKFSSTFRTRVRPLPAAIAAAVVDAWERRIAATDRATRYWESLPYRPPRPDTKRQDTYRRLLAIARGNSISTKPVTAPCRPRRKTCP